MPWVPPVTTAPAREFLCGRYHLSPPVYNTPMVRDFMRSNRRVFGAKRQETLLLWIYFPKQ